jgi:hypothetical protein
MMLEVMCHCAATCVHICRVPQEERPIFWEVIVSVILSKKVYENMCPIPNGFRDTAISLYRSKIADKILLLIPVFIIQVKKLLQFA